jgi:hypothetical protein
MFEQEILNELRTLNRNIERLFQQGHVVDVPREAATTRALEFAQYQHDMANAPDEATRKKITKSWNNKRRKEGKS